MDEMKHDALVRKMTHETLLRSKESRQEAVATFPLRVATMAQDMSQLIELTRGCEVDLSTEQAIDYLEDKIRKEFVATFGHDMIAETTE